MSGVVLFGIGSPLIVDFEASLSRASIPLAAGVRNHPGECFLSDTAGIIPVSQVTDATRSLPFLVPLFTPGNRQSAFHEAQSLGFGRPFSLIDPSVPMPVGVDYQPGFYVNAGCVLGSAARFGSFVLINRGASVGHHARLGDFVSIGPGAVVSGQVTIGKGSVVCAGAVVLPQITIGSNAVVGAGAIVKHDVPDNCLVIGDPARIVKRDIPGFNDKRVN